MNDDIRWQQRKENFDRAFNTLKKGGHLWIEMLEERNFLAHTYNEEQVQEALTKIQKKFLPGLIQVHQTLDSLV